jgi:hypothetical protein
MEEYYSKRKMSKARKKRSDNGDRGMMLLCTTYYTIRQRPVRTKTKAKKL